MQNRHGPSPSISQMIFPQFKQFPNNRCSVAKHVQYCDMICAIWHVTCYVTCGMTCAGFGGNGLMRLLQMPAMSSAAYLSMLLLYSRLRAAVVRNDRTRPTAGAVGPGASCACLLPRQLYRPGVGRIRQLRLSWFKPWYLSCKSRWVHHARQSPVSQRWWNKAAFREHAAILYGVDTCLVGNFC